MTESLTDAPNLAAYKIIKINLKVIQHTGGKYEYRENEFAVIALKILCAKRRKQGLRKDTFEGGAP